MSTNIEGQSVSPNDAKPVVSRRAFVNIYNDANGRFLGDKDYDTYEAAFGNRDQLTTYVETVEIVRPHGG